MMERVHTRELKIATSIACLTLLATCAPYVAGALAGSPELRFGGVLLLHQEDVLSYLAAMQQGARGSRTFRILFTPEEHEGALIYLFYLGLGKIAHMLGLSVVVMYHLARIAAGACELAAIYAFTGRFVKSPVRTTAYALACVGSGLGWLIAIAQAIAAGHGLPHPGWDPIDFWLVDAYTLPTILVFPHGALAVALMLTAALCALDYQESGRVRSLISAALLAPALAVVQPICLGTLAGALGVYLILLAWARKAQPTQREMTGTLTVGLIAVAAAAYYRHIFSTNPTFSAWQAQNLTPSPMPLHWLLGYGVILPPAIAGGIHILREKDERSLLLPAWLLATGALLYLPGPQRRFAQGLITPLSCLAGLGLSRWLGEEPFRELFGFTNSKIVSGGQLCPGHNLPGRWITPRFMLELVLLLSVLSNIVLVTAHIRGCVTRDEGLFPPADRLAAIHWLAKHTSPADTVLASLANGSLIPALIGHRTFIGHWCETTDFDTKARELATFFDPATSDGWRRAFLGRYNIRYLFYGPEEQALGEFDPEGAPYLAGCYRQGRYTVYRVKGESQ